LTSARVGLLVVAGVAAVTGVVTVQSTAHTSARLTPTPTESAVAAELSDLPAPASLGLHVGRPRPLPNLATPSRWSNVLRQVTARRAPGRREPVIAVVGTRTPEGTANILLVQGSRTVAGSLWLRVRLPILPNNATGWVPRSALGAYHVVETHLVVDRERLSATLYDSGRPVFRAPIGVGQARWPTPTGSFYVRDRVTGYRSPFYGPIAFGTSARSTVLTDWPGGGFIGIHGTDQAGLLPGRVSHGCIRMRNADIRRLAALMPVGTPLTIQ